MVTIINSILSMNYLEKLNKSDFPFDWANLDYYPDSLANRKEIYIKDNGILSDELMILFYSLFGSRNPHLIIYDTSWWDFCLDTWDPNTDKYDYEPATKSAPTQLYLTMLKDSGIEPGYSGCCKCQDWNGYLPIVLNCLLSHIAPYSPLFCDVENQYFFYFHHSGSIGIYYKEENIATKELLEIACKEYKVISY